MDIGHWKILSLAAVAGSFCIFSGCSESRGYVDYTSIPGPSPASSASDAESDDGQTPSLMPVEDADSATPNSRAEPSEVSANESNDKGSAEAAASTKDPVSPSSDATDVATSAAAKAEMSGAVVPAVGKVDSAENSASSEVVPTSGSTTDSADVPTGAAAAVANYEGAGDSAEPREIRLLVPEKRFRTEGDQQALRVSYDDIDLLKVLNMEPVPVDADQHFPEWLTQLDGQRIRIRGFMYPTFEATGLKAFTLARDNGICCFVREPKIYDIISIKLAKGQTSDYIDNKPFDVEGIFRIAPEADEEELYQLYRIEDATVLK